MVNKDSPEPGEDDPSPAPSPKWQARAWREYEKAQARIRQMLAENREPNAPAPTITAPTRRALDFTPQQRSEMCSLYYSGVPVRRIAAMFATTIAVVRAVVKMSLYGSLACLSWQIERAPNGLTLFDFPIALFL